MKINQQALNAIRGSAITGENLAQLFEKMAAGVETVGSPGGLLILSYIDPKSMPAEDELVPTLTLALKPFTLRQPAPEEKQDGKHEPTYHSTSRSPNHEVGKD